jgi:hypothetical protein
LFDNGYVPRSIHKCPNCGEPVSPFAAGCAICGENLVVARNQLAQRRSWIDRMPQISFGSDWLMFGLCLLLALGAPVVGFLLGGFLAWQADNDAEIRRRNLMFVVIAVAVIQMATGYALFGRFLFGV